MDDGRQLWQNIYPRGVTPGPYTEGRADRIARLAFETVVTLLRIAFGLLRLMVALLALVLRFCFRPLTRIARHEARMYQAGKQLAKRGRYMGRLF